MLFSVHSNHLNSKRFQLFGSSPFGRSLQFADAIRRLEEISKRVEPLWDYLSKAAAFTKLELQAQLEVSRGPGSKKERYLRAFDIMEKAVKVCDRYYFEVFSFVCVVYTCGGIHKGAVQCTSISSMSSQQERVVRYVKLCE